MSCTLSQIGILHVIIYMYRIMAAMKAETDVIASIVVSLIGQAMILYVNTFKTSRNVLTDYCNHQTQSDDY